MEKLLKEGIDRISKTGVAISLVAAVAAGILPQNNAHADELMAGRVVKVTWIEMLKTNTGNWFRDNVVNNVLPTALATAGGALGAGASNNNTENVAAAALGGAAGMLAGASLSDALSKVDGVRVIFRTDDGKIHYIDMTREQYEDYKLSCFKGSDILVSAGYQNNKLIDCSAPMNVEYQPSSRQGFSQNGNLRNDEGANFFETGYNSRRRR